MDGMAREAVIRAHMALLRCLLEMIERDALTLQLRDLSPNRVSRPSVPAGEAIAIDLLKLAASLAQRFHIVLRNSLRADLYAVLLVLFRVLQFLHGFMPE